MPPLSPLVSIGLPVYNGASYLQNALDCLLAQDYPHLELVIADNCSTDETVAICEAYAARDARIRFVRNERNIGACANFNRVFELSTGSYFMWAAHDDQWDPSYVRKCVELLQAHPEAVACVADVAFLDESGRYKPERTAQYRSLEALEADPAVRLRRFMEQWGWYDIYGLIRREALEATRLTQEVFGSDVILTLELLMLGPIVKVHEHLFYYREIPKTLEDYCRGLPPEGRPRRGPYTDLAQRLYQVVSGPLVAEPEHARLQDVMVEALAFCHPRWLSALCMEAGSQRVDTPRALKGFVRELLAGVREAPPAVSIVVPLSNGIESTVRCLGHLSEHSAGTRYEVILVDDGTTDQTREFLQMLEGDVTILTNARATGFAAACNRAAQQAQGEYVIFLDTQLAPEPGWLDGLLADAQADAEAGIIGATVVSAAGLPVACHVGVAFDEQGQPHYLHAGCLMSQPFVAQRRELQAVAGGLLMVRRSLFERLGGFEATLGRDAAMMDLCLRARRAHHRVVLSLRGRLTSERLAFAPTDTAPFVARWQGQLSADLAALRRADGLEGPAEGGLRIAIASPLAPQRTGVSHFTAAQVPELGQFAAVELFVDEFVPDEPELLAHVPVRRLADLPAAHAARPYDRILYHLGNNGYHANIYRMAQALPGVVELHEYDIRGCAGTANNAALLNALLPQAQGLIVHNEHSRRLLARAFPGLPIAVVPLPASMSAAGDRQAARLRLDLPLDAFVVASLGLVTPHKRASVTIEAFGRFSAQAPNSVLVLAGDVPEAPYRAHLEALIQRLGLTERVRFTGWLSEAEYADYLAAADVTVNLRYPSLGEESGSLKHILGSGRAAIVSRYAQFDELPDDGVVKIGFTHEVASLAEALERLHRDPGAREAMARRCQRAILADTSPAHIAQRLVTALATMSGQPARRAAPAMVRWEGNPYRFAAAERPLLLALAGHDGPIRLEAPAVPGETPWLEPGTRARLEAMQATPATDRYVHVYAGAPAAYKRPSDALHAVAIAAEPLDSAAAHALAQADEIWVLAAGAGEVLLANGVPAERMRAMPAGVDPLIYGTTVNTRFPFSGFRFLVMSDLVAPDSWMPALAAFLKTFSPAEPAELLIKALPHTNAAHDTQLRVQSGLRDFFLRYPELEGADLSRVNVTDRVLTDGEMPAFYAQANALIALGAPPRATRSVIEAQAVGLAVVISDGAGLSPGSYLEAGGDLEALSVLMRQLVADPAGTQALGAQARMGVLGGPTAAEAAQAMAERLEMLRQHHSKALAAAPVSAPAVASGPLAPPRLPLPADRPVETVWLGPLFEPSGYADEARHFVMALQAQHVLLAARQNGRESATFEAQLDPIAAGRLRRAMAQDPGPNPIMVVHGPAIAFGRLQRGAYQIGRTMFETDGLPRGWAGLCNQMDEVWVPTDFNLETFRQAGVTTRLVKVPGGIDTEQFRPGLAPWPIAGLRGTVFLSVFEWSLRKGWDVLLRAWAQAFGPDDDVCLVLRTYPMNQTEGGSQAIIERRIDEFLASLGLARSAVAPIVVVTEQIPAQDMPRLYAAADVYVAPSRGEGWGRPHMEAMATGLPVLATRWSGNLEFMNEDNSYLIDIEGLVPVSEAAELPYYLGQRWAEPSVPHLAALLQRVVAHPDEAAAKGARAREDVMRDWSWERAAAIAAARLAAIEAELKQPTPPVAPDSVPVRWSGDQFEYHSLAHVNREIGQRLAASGSVELEISADRQPGLSPWSEPRYAELARRFGRGLTRPAAVHVRHQWPPDFSAPPEGALVMVQPWEFGGLPDEWVAPMRELADEIWCYTEYVKSCYEASGVPADKLKVIPLGVDAARFTPEGEAFPLKTDKRFKFLFVGGTIARKGIDVLVNAYLRAFSAEDDVCLVIKGVGAKTFYRTLSTEDEIQRLASRPGAPAVELISDDLSDAEMAALYRSCDALVHPYRGEGFGLPIAEAMASGLPVIVTGAGACLDFCDDQTAYLIPATMVPVPNSSELGPGATGYWWAEPDPDALVRLMRHVVSHPDEARAVGARARARIATSFNWERTTALVEARLRALAELPQPRRLQPDPWPLDGRKGQAYLLGVDAGAAWVQTLADYVLTHGPDADATLVLWLDPGGELSPAIAEDTIRRALQAVGVSPEAAPDLLLVTDAPGDASLYRLIAAVDGVFDDGGRVAAAARTLGKTVVQVPLPSSL